MHIKSMYINLVLCSNPPTGKLVKKKKTAAKSRKHASERLKKDQA